MTTKPLVAALCLTATAAAPVGPVDVRTSDVATFYRLYDAANGAPSAATLQRDYIDGGSAGVRDFVPNRIISGEALARKIAQEPAVYRRARSCLAVLPQVKHRLGGAFRRLVALTGRTDWPPVTVLIGRDNSGGTAGPSGVMIGLEVACGADHMQPDLSNRLYHLIAHEYGHVLQPPEAANPTVLRQSLTEGVAELVADLISGQVSNVHLARWTRGHEQAIGRRFLAESDRTDLSGWLYQGPGTPAAPGDLGYWVGYRIAKSYYERATDKRAALRTLLALDDPKAILAASGWRPGR